MMKKTCLFVILVLAFVLGGCYSKTGNDMIDAEGSLSLISSADEVKIDVHNLTFNNDVDVYVGSDKIGDISGEFIAIWDTLDFTDSEGNIIRTGKQNPFLLFDNWTVYDENDTVLFIMKQNPTILGTSYDILDAEENKLATLKRGAIQMSNSATITDLDDKVITEIVQSPFMHDFTIKFSDTDNIDKESLIAICTNYMMQKLYSESK